MNPSVTVTFTFHDKKMMASRARLRQCQLKLPGTAFLIPPALGHELLLGKLTVKLTTVAHVAPTEPELVPELWLEGHLEPDPGETSQSVQAELDDTPAEEVWFEKGTEQHNDADCITCLIFDREMGDKIPW